MPAAHSFAVALIGSAFATVVAGAQIVETKAAQATVTIQIDASKPAAYRIPRTIFGSFLEPIGNSTYNGLWAEILQNPSLEENLWDVSHIATMVREEPGLSRASGLGLPLPWEPLNPGQGNRYEPHWGDASNSWRSLEVMGVPGQETGIKQMVYLPVHRVLKYEGSLFGKHLDGPSTVTLQIRRRDSAEVIASTTVNAAASDWTKYPFSIEVPAGKVDRLEPTDFVVLLDGDERVDLDNINLFPADSIDGLDPDEVRMAKEMHTPLVRFGGNFTSGYHW